MGTLASVSQPSSQAVSVALCTSGLASGSCNGGGISQDGLFGLKGPSIDLYVSPNMGLRGPW